MARLVVLDDPRAACCGCMGLLRPRVVISTGALGALTPAQLKAVLVHEADHARHRDPLLIMLVRAAGVGLFFVPLARRLAWLAVARAELAADASAVQAAGRPALIGALLALGPAVPAAGAVAQVSSVEVMDLRIAALGGTPVIGTQVVGRLLGAGVVIPAGPAPPAWSRPCPDQRRPRPTPPSWSCRPGSVPAGPTAPQAATSRCAPTSPATGPT